MRASLFCLIVWGCCAARAVSAGEHSFDSNGVKIHYTDEGEGPPVVLIHGYRASGLMNWQIPGISAQLTKKYRVITIDNRGHGASDKPTLVSQYGAHMAADVVRLLDHLELDSAHLVGYSMGGMITLKVLALHPERVRSAVIGGMGWIELPAEGLPALSSQTEQKPLEACGQAFPDLGITRDQLAEITRPMIVVIGTDDGLLGRCVDPLRKVRPDVPVVEIAEANHVTCIFRPQFRQAILDYLAEQSADSPADAKP
jgi:pimeloyl-ACP methyl ester carboxylesterase